jgi:hypothetical protein
MTQPPAPCTVPAAIVLCLMTALSSACKTTVIGVTNTMGTYKVLVKADPGPAADAVKKALGELDLILISHEVTGLDGRIIARTARDKRIKINIVKEGEQISSLSIRVGTTGDEGFSLTILGKIKEQIWTMSNGK